MLTAFLNKASKTSKLRWLFVSVALLLTGALLTVLIPACQIPIDDYRNEDTEQFLQFEVEVTNSYAKAYISRTAIVLAGNPRVEKLVTPDELYITDSQGNRHDLPIDGRADSTFHGVEGEQYKFRAMIQGKLYESNLEVMPKAATIDTVYYVFNTREDYLDDNPLRHGFDVAVRFKDLDEQGNYYNWEWVNYTKRYRCGTGEVFNTLYNIPCETDCWDININPNITLFSDANINGATQDIPLTRVPFITPPYKYYLRVEQRTISRTVYDFLNSAREQTQSNGGQFDVPAQTRFSPNIFCRTDPDVKVLGVFNVFSSDTKLIYIDRSVTIQGISAKVDGESLRPPYQCNPVFPPPCRLPCPNTRFVTSVVPPGWVE